MDEYIVLEKYPRLNTEVWFHLDLQYYNVMVDGVFVFTSNLLIEVADYINTLFQDLEYQEVHNE